MHHRVYPDSPTEPPSPSFVFDVTDYPLASRQVRPLPKRHASSIASLSGHQLSGVGSRSYELTPQSMAMPPLPPEGASTAEIMAQFDELSNFYHPFINDVVRAQIASGALNDFPETKRNGGDEDDQGDGDYFEHLQQPGNTKKRKVPSAAAGSVIGGASTAEYDENTIPEQIGGDTQTHPPPHTISPRRKKKPSAITRAGIRHKETLQTRKGQLSAVLGALTNGDTLALDQALSSNYFYSSPTLRIRPSKRPGARKARAVREISKIRHPDNTGMYAANFTFSYPSASKCCMLSSDCHRF